MDGVFSLAVLSISSLNLSPVCQSAFGGSKMDDTMERGFEDLLSSELGREDIFGG